MTPHYTLRQRLRMLRCRLFGHRVLRRERQRVERAGMPVRFATCARCGTGVELRNVAGAWIR